MKIVIEKIPNTSGDMLGTCLRINKYDSLLKKPTNSRSIINLIKTGNYLVQQFSGRFIISPVVLI